MSVWDHICGGFTTSAQCPECVAEDRAAHESTRRLGLYLDQARSMPDDCEACDTRNWPSELRDPGNGTTLVAWYHCRGCGKWYRCSWARECVFGPAKPVTPSRSKQAIPRSLVKQVMERDAYRCQQPGCGTYLDLTVDHVHPESLGGPTELANLQTLCRSHNSSKAAKVP